MAHRKGCVLSLSSHTEKPGTQEKAPQLGVIRVFFEPPLLIEVNSAKDMKDVLESLLQLSAVR